MDLGGRLEHAERFIDAATLVCDQACRHAETGPPMLVVDNAPDLSDEYRLRWLCEPTRGVFRKPFADDSWDDLREQFDTSKDCAPTCTVGCVRTASRFDEWRGQRKQFLLPAAPDVLADALVRR